MNERKDDDDFKRDSEEGPPSIWLGALGIVSLLFIFVILAYIPWGYYYKHTLLWDDEQGVSVFLGVLAILNAVSLLVRVRLVEDSNTSWRKVDDPHVSMAYSSLANILFWAGMALWLVSQDMNVSKFVCYALAGTGSLGHSLLHFARWQAAKKANKERPEKRLAYAEKSAAFLAAMYAAVLAGLTVALLASLSGPS